MSEPMRDEYVTIDGRTDWEAYQQDLAAWQAGPMLEEEADPLCEHCATPRAHHARPVLVSVGVSDDPWVDAVPVGTAPTVVPF